MQLNIFEQHYLLSCDAVLSIIKVTTSFRNAVHSSPTLKTEAVGSSERQINFY